MQPTVTSTLTPIVTGYSDAFSKFYTTPNDLRGALAYAFYKQQKLEFIRDNNYPPDHERVREYHKDLNETRVRQFLELADKTLEEFGAAILADTTNEIRVEVTEGVISDRLQEIEAAIVAGPILQQLNAYQILLKDIKSGTAWWKAVVYAVLGGFVFGAVLYLAKAIEFTNPLDATPPKHQMQNETSK